MLKLKWFILGSLCYLWVSLAVAEDVKCKDEFVKEPPLLQTSPELSQQTPRLKNQVQTSSHRWMSFEEAKAFIQAQGIQTSIAFKKWRREGKRPEDFPSTPNIVYKEEWTGWRDFLGTGKKWMSFEEAQTFIQDEGIRTYRQFKEWKREGKRPRDFPSTPHKTYKEEWTSWGDFLGTGRKWMSFEEAQTFIQSEGIQTSTEFRKWSREGKRPRDFPSAPEQTYKEEWTGWEDFLGTGSTVPKKQERMSFEEAQDFIQKEGIQTSTEFRKWSREGKRPDNFPSAPEQIYKEEWTGWEDFLGTGRKWMSFEEAQDFIRSEGIQTSIEFERWKRAGNRPDNFPSAPHRTYKEEWTGWGDFLGTGNIISYMKYKNAKKYVQTLGFEKPKDFIKWLSSNDRPTYFPPNPHQFYLEWVSVTDFLSTEQNTSHREGNFFAPNLEMTNPGDFLGTGRKWMSFEEARALIQSEGIQTRMEFEAWKRAGKRPRDFPANPHRTYKEEWTGWGDFLGIGRKWMSFEEAKDFIQNEGIQTSIEFEEWRSAGKRPDNFPSVPHQTYKEEWTGWSDFLGTDRKWMSFEEAQDFIRNEGIQSHKEFKEWKRAGKRPDNFPSAPEKIYKEEWPGWEVFLGTERQWMSFEEAQTFIRNEGIQTSVEFEEWKRAGKRPDNFPSAPEKNYKEEWPGWEVFLGTERQWMSFEDAKAFIQNEGVQTSMEFEEWKQAGKRPGDFPSAPHRTYKEEWTGWGDFLGTGNTISYMKYKNAKKYIQTLGFEQPKDFIEWLKSSDRPIHFPPNPHQFYPEWISVKDFLSTEQYVSYKEAKTFVQSLAITNPRDFLEAMRDEPDVFPDNFPPNPKVFYSKAGDWIDWNDFLGLTDQSKNEADDRRILNTEDNLQNEEMEEDDFVDEINLQYADMY